MRSMRLLLITTRTQLCWLGATVSLYAGLITLKAELQPFFLKAYIDAGALDGNELCRLEMVDCISKQAATW